MGEFETNPYHDTKYLSLGEPITKWTLGKRACTYSLDILVATTVEELTCTPVSRHFDLRVRCLRGADMHSWVDMVDIIGTASDLT